MQKKEQCLSKCPELKHPDVVLVKHHAQYSLG